jgi:hypothetical protein
VKNKFYIWPEDDYSSYKILDRKPDKYWGGFAILGTRFHPIGDFDTDEFVVPDEPCRIYQTRKGYRIFFTGRYAPDLDLMLDELIERGGDPLYSKYCRKKRYYAARLDPKYESLTGNPCVTRLVMAQGTPLEPWNEIISLHDDWTGALRSGCELC